MCARCKGTGKHDACFHYFCVVYDNKKNTAGRIDECPDGDDACEDYFGTAFAAVFLTIVFGPCWAASGAMCCQCLPCVQTECGECDGKGRVRWQPMRKEYVAAGAQVAG